jgi:S1/P1 Nuclease
MAVRTLTVRVGALHRCLFCIAYLTFRLVSIQFCMLEVESWGKIGHEIVANLAWRILSNETRQVIVDILGVTAAATEVSRLVPPADSMNQHFEGSRILQSSLQQPAKASPSSCNSEFCSPLADVADWADQVRHQNAYQWSGPLHYIDVRDDLIDGGCPVVASDEEDKECSDRVSEWNGHGYSLAQCNACFFNYSRDCVGDRCVAGAIANYTHRLVQATEWYTSKVPVLEKGLHKTESYEPTTVPEKWQLQESLKFLTHFVGDIHQPLHCSRATDRGGNSIKVTWSIHASTEDLTRSTIYVRATSSHLRNRFQRRVANGRHGPTLHRSHLIDNLHAVWDDGIVGAVLADRFNRSRSNLEQFLYEFIEQAHSSSKARKSKTWERWMSCPSGRLDQCASQWGQESWVLAMNFAYRDERNKSIITGDTLSVEYYHTRLPIVYERLAAAGLRLAITLSDALSGPTGQRRFTFD